MAVDILMLCMNWKKSFSPRTITALKHVYCRYLSAGLRRHGCKLYYAHVPAAAVPESRKAEVYAEQEIPAVDHVLCCEQDVLTHHQRFNGSTLFFDRFREQTRGLITSFRDRPRADSLSDILFTATATRDIPGNVWVGPAVDPQLFQSRQLPEPITICFDHAISTQDIRATLVEQAREFARKRFDPIRIVELPVRTNQRELANLMSRSHVFVTTHPESFGMTVCEAGMSGCLVVSKSGFIHPEILKRVQHITHDGTIPWDAVLACANPSGCRQVAMANCDRWAEITEIVYDQFLHA